MDLVVYHVVQLQVVHVTDSDGVVEVLSGPSVSQPHLAVSLDLHTLP